MLNKVRISFMKWYIRQSIKKMGKRTSSPKQKMNFLIISTTGIGDTLWGTPAIKALRKKYPEANIVVLTSPLGFECLKNNPSINELNIFSKGLFNSFRLLFFTIRMRMIHVDCIFIFHHSDKLILPLVHFMKPYDVIGNQGISEWAFSLTQYPQSLGAHMIDNRMALVKCVGAKTSNPEIELWLTEKEIKEGDKLLHKKGITRKSNSKTFLIGFNPGAQKQYKMWSSDNFIEVGRLLLEKYPCRIIITGSKKEKNLGDNIVSALGENVVNYAGELSVRQSASIIKKMDLFITNDTGPMHIAYALKVPVIALFCPTDPLSCGPYNTANNKVIYKKPTCDSCIGKSCDKPVCMDQITVAEVFEAVSQLIKKQFSPPVNSIFR